MTSNPTAEDDWHQRYFESTIGASIDVGPHRVRYLPREVTVPQQDIDSTLDSLDKGRREEIKAGPRRQEYERSRWLIRQTTGYQGELPRRDDATPTWPPGCLGSITHKGGDVAIAVASRSNCSGIGIDMESKDKMKVEFAERIALTSEIKRIEEHCRKHPATLIDGLTILFSGKEALYKCLFPIGGVFLGFHDVELLRWTEDRLDFHLKVEATPKHPKDSILRVNVHTPFTELRSDLVLTICTTP